MTIRIETAQLGIGYRVKGKLIRQLCSDLSLDLRAGEFACLLGPNGAGKSTLIRTLAGIETPLTGEVFVDGTPLAVLSPRQRAHRISVVLTESLPLGLFTGRAVVALGRHPHTRWTGRLGPKDQMRIDEALQAVEGQSLADRQLSEMSDGERQKILVARALAQEAKVLLLDEPTAYLDLPRRVELMRTLRDLARDKGLSILMSTHDLDLAMRSADTLWVLSNEGALTKGAPEELALQGTLQSAFASRSLDWDDEQGTFRLHREPSEWVGLEGEGKSYAWTRRALLRVGYGIAEGSQPHAFTIRISEKSGPNWILVDEAGERAVESLSALLDLLETNPLPK